MNTLRELIEKEKQMPQVVNDYDDKIRDLLSDARGEIADLMDALQWYRDTGDDRQMLKLGQILDKKLNGEG